MNIAQACIETLFLSCKSVLPHFEVWESALCFCIYFTGSTSEGRDDQENGDFPWELSQKVCCDETSAGTHVSRLYKR